MALYNIILGYILAFVVGIQVGVFIMMLINRE